MAIASAAKEDCSSMTFLLATYFAAFSTLAFGVAQSRRYAEVLVSNNTHHDLRLCLVGCVGQGAMAEVGATAGQEFRDKCRNKSETRPLWRVGSHWFRLRVRLS